MWVHECKQCKWYSESKLEAKKHIIDVHHVELEFGQCKRCEDFFIIEFSGQNVCCRAECMVGVSLE